MTDTPGCTGQHLIAGVWQRSATSFDSDPLHGAPMAFAAGGAVEIDRAARAAAEAFETFGWSPRAQRAEFLEAIALHIEARSAALSDMAMAETGRPAARLESDRAHTCGQLRLFAAHLREGSYLDIRHDPGAPRTPRSAPDAASGWTGGGVWYREFPAGDFHCGWQHRCPRSLLAVRWSTRAIRAIPAPAKSSRRPSPRRSMKPANLLGCFPWCRRTLLRPAWRWCSIRPSRRLDSPVLIAAARRCSIWPWRGPSRSRSMASWDRSTRCLSCPLPWPARGADLGAAWAGSLTLEAGQLCTKPGMVILPENTGAGAFKTAALAALRATAPQQMRDADTARAYGEGVARLGGAGLDRLLGAQHSAARAVAPAVFEVAATDWLARPDLAQEVFGPAGVLIRTATDAERLAVAKALQGQLTATLLMDEADMAAARALLGVLEHKAGRVLANGFPTEVEVADAVVHGGPFPASTSFGAASGGSMAIRRFLRPVCYQNIPEALLPPDLRGRSQAGCAGVGGRRP